MIKCTILKNGNLKITAGNETRAYVKYMLDSKRFSYWFIMSGLFEEYSCDGSYSHFNAGKANPFVGLTSAPCIAESMDYTDDQGKREVIGKCWAFMDYQVRDDLEELKNKGCVVYQLVK